MTDFRFGVHTRERLNAFARDGYAVIVPLAATEQHGPHLPVRTDTLICGRICEEAVRIASAEDEAKLLLAPTLSIGCSEHHLEFGGTISFSPTLYLQMLLDIGRSLYESGFKRIIFLNGHGGNEWQMQQAATDIALRYPVWTAAGSYWNIADKALRQAGAGEFGFVPGHAGAFETSIVMALSADEVINNRRPSGHRPMSPGTEGMTNVNIGRKGLLTGFGGVTDSSEAASKESGLRYVRAITEAVAQWLITCTVQMEVEA